MPRVISYIVLAGSAVSIGDDTFIDHHFQFEIPGRLERRASAACNLGFSSMRRWGSETASTPQCDRGPDPDLQQRAQAIVA